MPTIMFSPAPGTALVQELKKTNVEEKSSGLLLPTNAQNETVKRCLVITANKHYNSDINANDKVVLREKDLKDIITFDDEVFHIIQIENILGKIED